MKRYKMIEKILGELNNDDIALFTTGMISREAFNIKDRKSNFYVIGSMGLISSIGLGIALNTKKKVVIFDGDGSVLMDMGTMAMIGSEKPVNLIHVLLDNECYQSTGRQSTISKNIDFVSIAKSLGYKNAIKIDNEDDIKNINIFANWEGPVCIHLKVDNTGMESPSRVSFSPEELTKRLREMFLKK